MCARRLTCRRVMCRNLILMLVSFSLFIFTPARGAMTIRANSSLDSFSYDLDNIHLKLEKLDASWQLSPTGDGQLLIDKLRAKRLVITIGNNAAKTGNAGLPERIKPPFPIKIQQAEIAEVLLIKNGETQSFSHLKLDLEADAKTIKINALQASTPWGDTATTLQMATNAPFALNGVTTLKKMEGNTPYDIKAQLAGDLKTLHFDSAFNLVKQGNQWALLQNNLQSNQEDSSIAQISATGQIGLADDYPLSAKLSINALHAERLGNFPAAKLNIDANLQGNLLPTLTAKVQWATRDSQWQNQALLGSGNVQFEGAQIRQLDLQASLANNRLQAKGSLGQANSKLAWQADFADLSTFGAAYAGQASASGSLTGTFDNLAMQFKLLANNIRLPNGLKAHSIAGQATMLADENGKAEGEFKASQLQYGKYPTTDARVALQGTRAQHQLNINATGKDFQFVSALQGGLVAKRWQGQLQSLTLDGISTVKLTAPAVLTLDAHGANLQKADFQLSKGRVLIDLLSADKNGFASTGHAEAIALQDVPAEWFSLPASLQGNPIFSAKWHLIANDTLNGNLTIWRESGDLSATAADGSSKPLGLQEVKLDATFVNNHADINAKLQGQNVGVVDAHLSTVFSKTATGFALLANAPLSLNGSAQVQTLAWLPLPPSLMDASFDGALDLTVAANGTLGAPNLSGNVNGKNLQFSLPTEGVNFSNGSLLASFENDQLRISKATWQGGEGHLSATGNMRLTQGKPTIDLDWTAEKFTAISRADRLLTLNGNGKTTLDNDLLTISGNFTVIKGLAELADEDTPTLGDDVVILGQAEAPEPALRILLNGLHIDLGKEFTLRGRGLDADLKGAVTFTGLTQYHPHTEGIIEVRQGSYFAYGQKLTIERGAINFNGTVDNPAVNIRAMRNSTPVNAGIEITGTVLVPITKLVSDPSVADSEKLSWLVLGHGMDQTTKTDYGLLSLAAGVLLSQGQSVPLQTQLARAAGLDEVSFAGGDANSAALVFGKRLSSRLYLSYQKSISGLLDVAKLTYNITSRWSLRGETGTESAVDVLYTFSFK